MEEYRFARCGSIYPQQFDDPRAVVLQVDGLTPDENGICDVTDRLQSLLDSVKQHDRRGIVLIPEGVYCISRTVYLPRAVRMIGFGKSRPRFVLKKNTPGFQKAPEGEKGEAVYLFWFTGNMPAVEGTIQDANPGTFYSAVSNIDFKIEEGNPAAVVLRAHFAQHGFVSHCVFDIGEGKAGIFDVGNEMENLVFLGGEYGIYTTKCSPGWPFVLVESAFKGQRTAGVLSRECGLTFSHVEFSHMPAACVVEDGYWEKLFWKDCVLEQISEPALQISREDNSCTQINPRNVWCRDVPRLMRQKDSGREARGAKGAYWVSSLLHGDVFTLGEKEPQRETVLEAEPAGEIAPVFDREISDLPPQETWRNVREFGAVGNGEVDDTEALQRALDQCAAVYLPQGTYRVTDTLHLREGGALIGLNPITTQLVLWENTSAWAGMGAPKAVLESCRGGYNLLSGVGIDTAARNPRAVGCKWMAGKGSYCNDIKFVGGHGQITEQQENVPTYNPSRTADYDPDRPWDSQYWSLWITENGGGTFKDIWSASPYAEAGIFLSETSTPGVMYQVSVEHHVRHEILMRNVENWKFLGIQTEEEVAESSWCQPYELTNCRKLLFANFYAFRVIWVDNPYPSVVRAWNCQELEFLNCHNFTQMKYTMENLYQDGNTGEKAGFWQLAKLSIPAVVPDGRLPTEKGLLRKLTGGLDCVDALCEDGKGNLYLCDSRLKRIYRWDPESQRLTLLTSLHFRPLSLACDTQGRLLVVTEYKPVKGSVVNGREELSTDEFEGRDGGGCYYPFFSMDRRVRVAVMDPDYPEDSLAVLPVVPIEEVNPQVLWYPANQWRDSGDMMSSFSQRDTHCYPAPDGKTAVVHNPALARAVGLTPILPGKEIFLVDEYSKCVVEVHAEENFTLTNPRISIQRGEYSCAVAEDGTLYVPDCLLYECRKGKKQRAILMEDRPSAVLIAGREKEYLYITARCGFYALRLK